MSDLPKSSTTRELAVMSVHCRFYMAAQQWGERLTDSHSNQCALIFERYAPCQMEIAGETPDETTCPLVLRIFGRTDVRTSETEGGRESE